MCRQHDVPAAQQHLGERHQHQGDDVGQDVVEHALVGHKGDDPNDAGKDGDNDRGEVQQHRGAATRARHATRWLPPSPPLLIHAPPGLARLRPSQALAPSTFECCPRAGQWQQWETRTCSSLVARGACNVMTGSSSCCPCNQDVHGRSSERGGLHGGVRMAQPGR